MRVAAGEVDSAAETIKGIQQRLHSHKADLLSGWDGNAARTFQRVFLAWDEDFGKVLNALNMIHENLVHTEIEYSSTEEQQEAAVSKVQALLDGST